jgi:hypothetical protein
LKLDLQFVEQLQSCRLGYLKFVKSVHPTTADLTLIVLVLVGPVRGMGPSVTSPTSVISPNGFISLSAFLLGLSRYGNEFVARLETCN